MIKDTVSIHHTFRQLLICYHCRINNNLDNLPNIKASAKSMNTTKEDIITLLENWYSMQCSVSCNENNSDVFCYICYEVV